MILGKCAFPIEGFYFKIEGYGLRNIDFEGC